MNNEQKIEDHSNVISATTGGEYKKSLEARWMKSVSITNIDTEEFEGMWDGNPYIIPAGESETFPVPLAEHLAANIASKMISKEGKIPSDNIPLYNQLVAKIMGNKKIDYEGMSYAELKELAYKEGKQITKDNGKLATKAELILILSIMDKLLESKFALQKEVEELIEQSRSLNAQKNDLTTEIRVQKNTLRELSIQVDNKIAEEKENIRVVNKEILEEIDSKQKHLSESEGWIFVQLAILSTIINKSENLLDLQKQGVKSSGNLYNSLEEEIKKYKTANFELSHKFKEMEEKTEKLNELLSIESQTLARQEFINKEIERIRIQSEKIEVEKEKFEKKSAYYENEHKKISEEWTKIGAQWKVLENTKLHLYGKANTNDR